MMERLRAGADSLVVKVILGLIILSFVFAGVGSYLIGGNEEPVALVGDVEISQAEFEQAYQNERQRMQEQAGDIFNSLIADPSYLFQFRSNVLDRMVNQTLLDQYAKSLGLRVSDEHVKNEIRAMPAFLSDGVFNNEQYLAALRRNGLAPEQFAEFIRQDLVREQLINALQNSEFTLNNELVNLYKLEEQSRTVRSLTLPLADFASKIELTQEQKEAYYKENAFQFMRPEQFKISYVELSGENLAQSIEVSDAEVQAFYDANLARFGSAEQRKVSHIMLEGTSEEQKQKAQKLLEELKQGADFATLAKANSEDSFSAEQGGQLDWFDRGVMDPAFEEAAFAIENKAGLSKVVQSDFGLHIIKLDDIKPSEIKAFAQVREEILTQLKEQKAAENFYNLSSKMAEKAFEVSDSLEEAANVVNLSVNTTSFVAMTELNGVLGNAMVRQALTQQDVRDGLNSELIEISAEHAIVVRIDDSRPEMTLAFEEVEKDVTKRLQNEKGQEAMQLLADKLTSELRESKEDALKASGYSFSEPMKVKRSEGSNRELTDLAFSMPKPNEGSSYRTTRSMTGDTLLVALDAITEPKLENVDLKALMADRVSQSLANANLLAVVDQLKQQIKITNNLAASNES